jgi:D-glycero-D-manno-heptose 1,7-bisphosphate phosphatase
LSVKLYLLDRDGVVVVNRPENIKTAADLELIPGATTAIARLKAAGYVVGMCTNQPEVGRGAVSAEQLHAVHDGLQKILERQGAHIDLVLCCTSARKCPRRKPSAGMLREALYRFGAEPSRTPYVGDQADDLKAALRAGCRQILVKTGLGAKTLAAGLPSYLSSVEVFEDLEAAVAAELKAKEA